MPTKTIDAVDLSIQEALNIIADLDEICDKLRSTGSFRFRSEPLYIQQVMFSNEVFRLTRYCGMCKIPLDTQTNMLDLDDVCLQCRWMCTCDYSNTPAGELCEFDQSTTPPPSSANFLYKVAPDNFICWNQSPEIYMETYLALGYESWDSIVSHCLASIS